MSILQVLKVLTGKCPLMTRLLQEDTQLERMLQGNSAETANAGGRRQADSIIHVVTPDRARTPDGREVILLD